jgi:DNA invertase Pin-like site-specific DNA recombinase
VQGVVQPGRSHNRTFILHEQQQEGGLMLIGYMRVSKSDGSQVLDLQRDALLNAGVDPEHIYADLASGRRDDRAGLASARARGRAGGRPYKMTSAKLRLAMAAMGKPATVVGDLCSELGITRQTLYRHIAPDGSLREPGQKLLQKKKGGSG